MRKILKALLWVLLAVLAVSLLSGWWMFGPLVKGAMYVRKFDEGLYYMEYKGDDGFDQGPFFRDVTRPQQIVIQ